MQKPEGGQWAIAVHFKDSSYVEKITIGCQENALLRLLMQERAGAPMNQSLCGFEYSLPGGVEKIATSEWLAHEKETMNMKKKIMIVLAVIVAASAPLAPEAKAIDFSISVGDRPYYYGPRYWNEGYEWVWVPGYRYHGRWIRGHYERRGGYHRDRATIHFRHHRNWDRNWDRR